MQNVLKQFIYPKVTNTFKVGSSKTKLDYNEVVGGVAIDGNNLYRCKQDKVQQIGLGIKEEIIGFGMY